MAGPAKLWKTEITIWSEVKPRPAAIENKLHQALDSPAEMTKCESHHVSGPYSQTDGPTEANFEEG